MKKILMNHHFQVFHKSACGIFDDYLGYVHTCFKLISAHFYILIS